MQRGARMIVHKIIDQTEEDKVICHCDKFNDPCARIVAGFRYDKGYYMCSICKAKVTK